LIQKWNKSINLVSAASIEGIWDRHIRDSAQLFQHRKSDVGHWVDIGSGGGLPGIVLSILAKGKQLPIRFTLVESDRRKSIFLDQAIRELDLDTAVICSRIEAVPPLQADIVSARALADLATLCSMAKRHLNPGGRAVFPKGLKSNEEILVARTQWAFDLLEAPSVTDDRATVLILESIRNV
jgi:16S rRNA (guanine527-N7)-methyltransferase